MPALDHFYDAKTAREIAIGARASAHSIVLVEINALQLAIDNAVVTNVLRVEVVNSTDITSNVGVDYFTAWNEIASTDPNSALYDPNAAPARERMNRVINYFTRLGYTIKREREGTTNRFKWVIIW